MIYIYIYVYIYIYIYTHIERERERERERRERERERARAYFDMFPNMSIHVTCLSIHGIHVVLNVSFRVSWKFPKRSVSNILARHFCSISQ